jgi:myo-inositol-1(or 4)-monophosphatase
VGNRPIDGTTSYAHGQFYYSVSIALLKNSKPILAAVYAPRLNENFTPRWARVRS